MHDEEWVTAGARVACQANGRVSQGEMINETGTMTGGGGKPRGGKICLGSAAPRALDMREAAAELAVAEGELAASTQVRRYNLGIGD